MQKKTELAFTPKQLGDALQELIDSEEQSRCNFSLERLNELERNSKTNNPKGRFDQKMLKKFFYDKKHPESDRGNDNSCDAQPNINGSSKQECYSGMLALNGIGLFGNKLQAKGSQESSSNISFMSYSN